MLPVSRDWHLWNTRTETCCSPSLVTQTYLELFKRVNVILPNCPLVSALISPLNYFTGYTSVSGIYTLVESMPGEANRSQLFTLAFYFNLLALSSFCLKLLLFIYLHFLLLSPAYTRKEKGHNEIIRFKLSHPIWCCKWLKKGLFSGTQLYLFFTTCSSCPHTLKTSSAPDIFLPRVSMGQLLIHLNVFRWINILFNYYEKQNRYIAIKYFVLFPGRAHSLFMLLINLRDANRNILGLATTPIS